MQKLLLALGRNNKDFVAKKTQQTCYNISYKKIKYYNAHVLL